VDQESKTQAFLVYPEVSEKTPVVLLIHENRGLNNWARSMADQIAEMGYIALAPDFLSGTAPTEAVLQLLKTQMLRVQQFINWTPPPFVLFWKMR
jgi:dienelactone hydrolase